MTQPSITSAAYDPDRLIAGDEALITRDVTIANGQNLARGALVGKITKGAGSITPDGGNTGNGAAGAVTLGKAAQVGDYNIECVEAATDAGRFKVIAPDGDRLDDLTVAVAYSNDHFGVTIADGATDFAVGDKFTLTVAAGSGEYTLSLAAAVDGSQDPEAVLADAVDASGGAKEGPIYEAGTFNDARVTFGTGHTADSVRAALRDKGIHLKKAVAA